MKKKEKMPRKKKTENVELIEEKKYEKKPTKGMLFIEENKNNYKMTYEDGVVMIICKNETEMENFKNKIGPKDFSYGFRILKN